MIVPSPRRVVRVYEKPRPRSLVHLQIGKEMLIVDFREGGPVGWEGMYL